MAELDSHREYAFVLNRQLAAPPLLPEQRWPYGPSEVHPDYLVEDVDAVPVDSPPPFSPTASILNRRVGRDAAVQAAMDNGEAITVNAFAEGRPYIISLLPIRDVMDRVAGYLISYAPDPLLAVHQKQYFIYIATAGAFIGMISALWMGLRRRTIALGLEQSSLKVMNDALAEGVYVCDTQGLIQRINPAACRKLGYEADELIGQPVHGRIHRHSINGHSITEKQCPFYRCMRRGEPHDGEASFQRKDGTLIDVEVAGRPIFLNQQWIGSVTAFHDITERKRMEEDLREKEHIQRTLMESLPVGFIIIDAKTRIIERVNRTAVRLFGAPEKYIVGNRCHRFMCPAEESACPILDLDQTVESLDRVLVRYDGASIPVLKTVNRIFIQSEEKLLECIIDIRERVAAEEALKEANQKLKAAIAEAEALAEKAETANRSKSVFLANMSHEIRTPLNAILGYSQLLQQDASLGRDHLAQVRTINRSGDHLLELINGILEMSKIEAGQIKVNNESMDLARLIEDINAIFQLSCRRKNLNLQTACADQLPKRIIADHGKIRQILINLMSNAVKFTSRGDITLHAAATMDGGQRWRVGIDVADSGHGIACSEQARLFQAFEQTASGHKTSEGTGLGLSISRAYARVMGGELQLVHSTVGRGSVFRFTFPAGKVDMSRQGVEERAPNQIVTGLMPGQPTPRALIVEDDPVSGKLLSKLLKKAGFEVDAVESGESALEIVERFSPQVVLMDIVLEGIDGYETARRMRRLPRGQRTKIIAVTASGTNADELRRNADAAGIDALVVKPFKIEKILNLIQSLCGVAYTFQAPPEADDAPSGHPPAKTDYAELPEDLRDALRSAVELGDMTAFNRLVPRVAAIDNTMQCRLVALARQYDYESLLELLTASPLRAAQG